MKKKSRGFRLGRKLLRIWRCLFRRCRTKRYLRLNPSPSQSQSQSESKSMTTKLFNWGRCLLARGGGYHRLGDQTPSEEEHGGESRPPKGHLAVYVGGGKKEGGPPHRYMLPVIYFNHPLFRELLREAEDEYGYNHPGGITIPCPISHFERVRTRIAAAESCPSGNRRRLSY